MVVQDGSSAPATSEAGVGTVADKLLAPVAVIAADSTVLYVNAAAAHAIGQSPSWLTGRRMLPLVHPQDRARVARELRQVTSGQRSAGITTYRVRGDAAQGWRVFESIADNLLDDPNVKGILLSSRDVTDQQAHQRELYEAAYRDPLTGLPNRRMIAERLDALMRDNLPFAVAFVGLDRFKLINDSLGHTTGDAVLQAVAARVRTAVPSAAMVGRFGGDLLVLLVSEATATQARELLWRVVERVGQPLFVAGQELRVSISVGIAQRHPTATAESILQDAGLALHQAKAQGGGRVSTFECSMREAAVARLELEANLRRAVGHSELALALQPIVRLEDGAAVRAEALLRWQHAGSAIDPDQFIPIAEETGLIVPLGDWIIDRAAQLLPRAPGGRIMVNLSARQLASPGLVDRIARVLAARHVAPASLGFEITETMLIDHFDYTVEVLSKIRRLGCPVGLDDFGTGYSSLGYLRRLPIDFLKIDGSLSADIDTDAQARTIIGAIITMAGALGLDVVAEGVETRTQARSLHELGCPHAQGHLFGRPARTE